MSQRRGNGVGGEHVRDVLEKDGGANHAPNVDNARVAADAAAPSPLATGRALILLQLLSRALTFVLNQGLVRHAPPSVFGTAAIQFDLVAATVLFLSREGVRNALLRGDGANGEGRDDAGLAAWPFRLGILVAALASGLYLFTAPASTTSQPYFHLALGVYVSGALAELLVEPLYVRAARSGSLRVRVAAEGGMAAVRAFLSFAVLVALPYLGDRDGRGALLGLAVGYAAGSYFLAARYIAAYGGVRVIPSLIWPSTSTQPPNGASKRAADPIRSLAIANTRQSVVKHVLTEADRIAVGYISPLGDQGGYAIAINYGSLVARIVFQPVEETLRLHWSRSLTGASTVPLLEFAVRGALYLVLLFPVFLPPLLPAVLPVLLPKKYTAETSAEATLQSYLVAYLPLLAVNGILESFHAASANPEQVASQAAVMGMSSATFVGVLWAFTRVVGSQAGFTTEQALIYASCAAMLVRIAYAGVHALRFARERGQRLAVAPRPLVIATTAAAGSAVWAVAARLAPLHTARDRLALLAVGAVAGCTVLAAIYIAERADARRLGRMLGGKAD